MPSEMQWLFAYAAGATMAGEMQMPCAGGGKGHASLGTLIRCEMQLPCAGGGKGRPRPLHPRPGTASLGTLI